MQTQEIIVYLCLVITFLNVFHILFIICLDQIMNIFNKLK